MKKYLISLLVMGLILLIGSTNLFSQTSSKEQKKLEKAEKKHLKEE